MLDSEADLALFGSSGAVEPPVPGAASALSSPGQHPCVFAGGRGKDKAWIITLPDNAAFNQVPQESVARVLSYLTSVPR